jgi:hypothetical protein
MLQSEGFLGVMMPMVFEGKDTFEIYKTMAKNFRKSVGKDKFEAILVKNSGHIE